MQDIKNMEVKHCRDPNYWLITPPEYTEETEDAETHGEEDRSVEMAVVNQCTFSSLESNFFTYNKPLFLPTSEKKAGTAGYEAIYF